MNVKTLWFCLLGSLLITLPLMGQGTTGVIRGTVTTGGSALPGVTVTVTSPALQGTRSVVTSGQGTFLIPALPPGTYQVVFELEGMNTIKKQTVVALGRTSPVDADLSVQAVEEVITITAAASVLETGEVSQNLTFDTIDELPIERTIRGATELAPGISTEGPRDQVMISGAPSYESLYLVNGAVVNENLRGQPQNVYIEDAISETTVYTGNVSAEYGRR